MDASRFVRTFFELQKYAKTCHVRSGHVELSRFAASGSVRLCREKSIENGLKYCFGPRLKREGSRSTFSDEIAKNPFSTSDIVFALALSLRSSSKLCKCP